MHIITARFANSSYPIYLGQDLMAHSDILRRHVASDQVMIVSNEVVASHYLDAVQKQLAGFVCHSILLPDGERHKTLETVGQVFDALIHHRHRRNTTLLALGGGVIGDITGFAAATYLRGVPYIHIPTSLLAQVDASIGGKTGVNHEAAKNMIGAFYQPQAVIADLSTLNTLDERQYRAGLAEVIKVALLADADFFAWLEDNMARLVARDQQAIMTALKRACQIKVDVVEEDEREAGARVLLNLGHTFAHAIETTLGYGRWLHGEAVAVGLLLAAEVSCRMGWLAAAEVSRVKQLLLLAKLPTVLPSTSDCEQLLATMALDKKNKRGKVRFVLLNSLGSATVYEEVDERVVISALCDYGARVQALA